ncbi:MAG: lysophospholipid acyltransferase family protein [Myxococcota bacterium]|nr:lysophospholipid acyltransferase family protein [Myxococcota bacterium]
MGVRVPLRAQRFSFLPMGDRNPVPERAGMLRWLTVGVFCYGGWIFVNLVLALLIPLIVVIDAAGGRWGKRAIRWFAVSFLRGFFLGFFQLVGVYRLVEQPNREQIARYKGCLFAANHRSWLDGLLLTALIPEVRIPADAAYLRIPLAGRMMRLLGCLPLDRKSRETTLSGLAGLKRAIQADLPVLVFPEGTRAQKGELKPFSPAFFKIAIEAQLPVVPVIIHMDYPFLGPGRENFLTAHKASLRIRFLEPVVPIDGERGVDLARRVQKCMRPVLQHLDAK